MFPRICRGVVMAGAPDRAGATGWPSAASAWYAAIIDISLRCVLMIARFRHDAWQRIEV